VIIVAHSMGGLATRCAANESCSGVAGVAARIRAVVTFDAPNLGTWLKSWGRSDIADLLGPFFGAVCVGTGNGLSIAKGICNELRAWTTSAAVKAFTPGSAQLSALPQLPRSIPLLALAGSVKLATSFFGHHVTTIGDLGDIVVSEDSALAAANVVDGLGGSLVLDCGYLDITQPSVLFTLRCSHLGPSETDSADFLAPTLGFITRVERADTPLRQTDLDSAPVPSLCQQRAGTLVNGVLPGIPVNKGGVALDKDKIALGDVNGDGVGDAAAVFTCSQGGVGWPNWIVFYTPGPHVLGAFDMGSVVGDARDGTTRITYANGAIQIDTLDARYSDPGCCPSGRATVVLRWNGQRIIATQVHHLVGPTDIRFDGIGPVTLGMTAQQLTGLGYTPSPGLLGCVDYSAPGKPYVTYDPHHSRTVAVTPDDPTKYQTYIGGIQTNYSLLDFIRTSFVGYKIDEYLNNDFGQGTDGVVVTGPGGSIGFTVSQPLSSDTGLATVIAIKVADANHATAAEVGCT
jgi:hypothetical protein